MTASPVKSFGKYLLDEEIARGGMSRVFLARLRGLGGFEKRLVVKQVLPELASDPRFVEMFVQEAKTLVQMSHPHIAPVFELGVVDGVYFLAMEHVAGATLSELLADGPMPPALVAHLGAQIGDALHYAHERFGIVHRDVTPRNVMVDEEGHARLLDFGIAAPASGEGAMALFGTPGYLSPEQANGEPLGPATDVFSLGAVLFEALTARRAFFARTVEEAKEVLTLDGPDFYPDDGVPDALAGIVARALERDPRRRYASARDLGRALRSWVAAHAPEGVGPELGEWARRASAPPPLRRDEEPEDAPRSGEVEVQTLATSRVLDELLEGARPVVERASADAEPEPGTAKLERASPLPAARLDEAEDAGTAKLERASPPPAARLDAVEDAGTAKLERASPPPAAASDEDDGGAELARPTQDDEPGTTRLDRASAAPRRGARDADDASAEEAVAPAAAARAEARPSRRLELGLLAVLAAGGLAWLAWPRAPEPRLRDVVPDAARAPEEDPPAEDLEPVEAPPDERPDPVPEPPPALDPPPEEAPAPRPVARGTLDVNSEQPAQAYLDGRLLGWTPVRGYAIRAGRHALSLRHPDLAGEARTTFEVAAGETVRLVGDLEDGEVHRAN